MYAQLALTLLYYYLSNVNCKFCYICISLCPLANIAWAY